MASEETITIEKGKLQKILNGFREVADRLEFIAKGEKKD